MISRGQMYRQMYYGGGKGITSLDAGAPSILYKGDITSGEMRQQYGLGSIVKKAVKGVTGAVKDVVKSDIGKAALTAAALYYAPGFGIKAQGGFAPFLQGAKTGIGNFLFGMPGDMGGRVAGTGILSKIGGMLPQTLGGKAALGITALGGLTGYLAGQGMNEQQIEEIKNRPEALKGYLAQYYSNLNPTASAEQVQNFVTSQLGEYAYAVGGRVGYSEGSSEDDEEMEEARELAEREGISLNKALGKMLEERFGRDRSPITRIKKAYGNTAQMAAGIEGLPYRENQAGVGEVDMRETGGFIPPVGVKEKADDIPAMLSNNEFVFTADAVRGMGNGNVNLGAQRMYDMMKKLEKGGRV